MSQMENSQVRNFIISIVVCESKVTVDFSATSKKIQIIEAKTMNNDIINSIVDQCRCMIVMFDKTRYPTFLKAKKILSIVQSNNELNIVLINNKSDIENVNEVDESEVKKEIDKFKDSFKSNVIISYFTFSNVTKNNIQKIKSHLESIYTKPNETFPKSITSVLKDKTDKSYEIIKLILLGDSGVGKSAFFNRFFKNEFDPTFTSTIGITDASKYIIINNTMLKIQIWDTAGQERFRSIPKKYYEKADGMLLLFDTTDPTTFANISKWTKDIHESTNDNIIIYLIANKCDLLDDRKVIVEDIKSVAKENRMKYYEVSCKWDVNVSEVVYSIVYDVYKYSILESGKDRNGFDVNRETHREKKKCCK